MKAHRFLLIGSLAMFVLSTACRRSNPASPSDSFAGTWSGSISDTSSGTGTLTFVLSAQQGGGLAGTWTAAFTDASHNDGGTLSAALPLGSPLLFGAACSGPGTVLFTMTASSSQMTGTYAGINCRGLERGTAEIAKQ